MSFSILFVCLGVSFICALCVVATVMFCADQPAATPASPYRRGRQNAGRGHLATTRAGVTKEEIGEQLTGSEAPH
ncbi:hypothetical protein L4X63_01915 [Geomonas sp. Red32]|uniref:hypothetical protein n=1 Tax=Geomonas sp. Red32 TaxID=2912856 RepID=UPI00202CB2B1|nr:hypothetical protein [Geomonas sp. Red32]MCM0080334.1 hypothetical protein [Geomonas sp. Red32]